MSSGNGLNLNGDGHTSETTPLLSSGNSVQDAETLVPTPTPQGDGSEDAAAEGPARSQRPLNKKQIFLLCVARFIEPVAFFSIFPFVNQMLQFIGGIAITDVGFWSGLIESLFSLTQMFVMIFYGRAADRIGRRPVLIFSLAGVSLAVSCFGFATSLWQMILFRCVAGLFAGSVVTIRTMITENSTRATQATAFSWFAFAGNLGIFFGPLIGGALAEPAKQYGGIFNDIAFFKAYPYALPSVAVGVIGLLATAANAWGIEETLQRASTQTVDDATCTGTSPAPKTTWELLKSPGVPMALYVYSYAMFLAQSFTAVVPVFWFTPVALGGYGFTPVQISSFMALLGFSQAFWLLAVFPPLQRRIGTNGVLRLCAVVYPFGFLCFPLLNFVLKEGGDTLFWVLGPILLLIFPGVSMAFTAVQLALNDVSPSPEVLGTLNALALTAISGQRSFVPALFGSIYAVGVREQILGGQLVWLVLMSIAVGFAVSCRWLPDQSEKDNVEVDVDEDNTASRTN